MAEEKKGISLSEGEKQTILSLRTWMLVIACLLFLFGALGFLLTFLSLFIVLKADLSAIIIPIFFGLIASLLIFFGLLLLKSGFSFKRSTDIEPGNQDYVMTGLGKLKTFFQFLSILIIVGFFLMVYLLYRHFSELPPLF